MAGILITSKWTEWSPNVRSVLRIVVAFLFIQAGTVKLFAFPIGVPPNGGMVPLLSERGLAGILETFGGTLLLIGFFARPVAVVLAGEMAVAYFQVHFSRGFWTYVNGGGPAVFYFFLWLYISAAGPGPWSLDAILRRRTRNLSLGDNSGNQRS